MNNPQSIDKMRLTLDQDKLVVHVADSLRKGDQVAAIQTWRQLLQSLIRTGSGISESDIRVLIQQTIQKVDPGVDVTKIANAETLETEIKALEEKLQIMGDDAQLANVDLQNILQKQQQTLQMLSTISKLLNETAMAVIRKMGG